jgi:hypothetical protein
VKVANPEYIATKKLRRILIAKKINVLARVLADSEGLPDRSTNPHYPYS